MDLDRWVFKGSLDNQYKVLIALGVLGILISIQLQSNKRNIPEYTPVPQPESGVVFGI